jgi:hypothetical protein
MNNFNFQGTSTVRTVRLSGASRTTVDTEEELRSKRALRESRQAERARESAAVVLQAAIRGARVRAMCRRERRTRFDALMASPSPSTAADPATRLFVRFFDAAQRSDLARFVRLVNAVEPALSAGGTLIDDVALLRPLVAVATALLRSAALALELHARCVQFIGAVALSRIAAAAIDAHELRRCAHGWLTAHAATSELEKSTAGKLLLVTISVTASSATDKHTCLFLLTIPLLVSRVRLLGAATRIACVAHIRAALSAGGVAADASARDFLVQSGALWALGNLLALSDDIEFADGAMLTNYLSTLSMLCQSVPDAAVSKKARSRMMEDGAVDDDEDDDDDDDDNDGGDDDDDGGDRSKPEFPSDVVPALQGFLCKQLARCGAVAQKVLALSTISPQHAVDVCMLCVLLQQRWPSVWSQAAVASNQAGASDWIDGLFTHNLGSLAFLAQIVLGDSVLAAVERAPLSLATAGARRIDLASAGARDLERSLVVVGVLARAMHRTASVMDDAELLDEAKLLPISELVRLCALLTNVLCRLHWCDVRCSARSALAQLLGGLVDRDARRRFCAPETWLVVGLDVSALVQLARQNARDQDAPDAAALLTDDVADADVGGSGAYDADALRHVSAMRAVLRHAPFCVPFAQRVHVLQAQLMAEQLRSAMRERSFFGQGSVQVRVHRDSVFSDAYEQLRSISTAQWRSRLRISFVSHTGVDEAGIDGGGLTKEFLLQCVREAFGSEYALFVETNGSRHLYPNPDADLVTDDWQAQLTFLGGIVGKALYESILVELPLASFFLGRLLGRVIQFDDLRSLDEELYRNLLWLKRAAPSEIEALELDFTATRSAFGRVQQVPLCAGGEKIAVTAANRTHYVRLMAHHLLSQQIRAQTAAFERGLARLVDVRLLRMFARHELQLLISGSDGAFDVDDMQAHTTLRRFGPDHETIGFFFDVVREMTPRQQSLLLLFTTGCSRPPLLGFAQLHPTLTIARAQSDDGADQDDSHLPTAATCMNMLRLPPYSTREVLREKLLAAIESGSGFDLS